jgi:hypothetical protein
MDTHTADYYVRLAMLNHGGVDGQCYVAAEAVYHLAGKREGWTPMVLKLPKGSKYKTHWFLQRGDGIVDPTEAQFRRPPSYRRARGCGFLTKRPSKRARVLIRRVRRWYGNYAR